MNTKNFLIGGFILMFIVISGCTTYVKPFTDAYDSTKHSIENVNVNSGVCSNDEWKDAPFVVCPDETKSQTVNATPTQSGT